MLASVLASVLAFVLASVLKDEWLKARWTHRGGARAAMKRSGPKRGWDLEAESKELGLGSWYLQMQATCKHGNKETKHKHVACASA